VKRPGTGEIKAAHYETLLGKKVKNAIPLNAQLTWADVNR
jgi:N-acetylneuraminate synthase